MLSRTALRSTRLARRRLPQARLQSTQGQSASVSQSSSTSAITGGLTGGALVFLGGYAWYHFSGTKSLISTAQQTKTQFDKYAASAKASAPEPNEALQWLRQQATSYAGFIPGARGYVNTAFNDLDEIRAKHGDEVDKIVREAYSELQDASKDGLSLETAMKSWDILQKHLRRISELAADSAQGILENHPSLKNAVGGDMDKLKELGDQYGGEAKKQVDETWSEISSIVKAGVSADSANRIRKLVQDKMAKMNEMGDEAWKTGMEKAKPYLDKSPQVKKLIEENADTLKQGNFAELYEKVKEAVDTGDMKNIESYIKGSVEKANESADGGIDQYLKMIPGGAEVLPKLSQLQEVAQKHGKEAEAIVKDTFEEVLQVLQKRVSQVQKLGEEAKDGAKKSAK
jgi:hypothetical protein